MCRHSFNGKKQEHTNAAGIVDPTIVFDFLRHWLCNKAITYISAGCRLTRCMINYGIGDKWVSPCLGKQMVE